jgi:hypothetical protein
LSGEGCDGHKPRPAQDLDDLKASLAFGNGSAATANMLCRDEARCVTRLGWKSTLGNLPGSSFRASPTR